MGYSYYKCEKCDECLYEESFEPCILCHENWREICIDCYEPVKFKDEEYQICFDCLIDDLEDKYFNNKDYEEFTLKIEDKVEFETIMKNKALAELVIKRNKILKKCNRFDRIEKKIMDKLGIEE